MMEVGDDCCDDIDVCEVLYQRTQTDNSKDETCPGRAGVRVKVEDGVMDDVLPSHIMKRKSQDENGIQSKKRKKGEKVIDNIKTEETNNCISRSDYCSTRSETEEDNKEKSSKMLKLRQLIQSPILMSAATPMDNEDTYGDIPGTSQVQSLPAHNNMYQSAKAHIQRCKDLLQKLKTEFTRSASLRGNPKVMQWKKDLEELETKLVLPKTVIAMVGDTGAGKSSLMNALLDQLDILPTSGLRACTAVVTEVVSNTDNDKYEADITFLSKEDWYEELRLLLRDLTNKNGKIKKKTPNPKSVAGVAFLKIKAVYGKIDRFEPVDFRNAIAEYIETADPGSGGQFWPIVKNVTIRLPNCDACSSGAVLVDLPGVRDANAA